MAPVIGRLVSTGTLAACGTDTARLITAHSVARCGDAYPAYRAALMDECNTTGSIAAVCRCDSSAPTTEVPVLATYAALATAAAMAAYEQAWSRRP